MAVEEEMVVVAGGPEKVEGCGRRGVAAAVVVALFVPSVAHV